MAHFQFSYSFTNLQPLLLKLFLLYTHIHLDRYKYNCLSLLHIACMNTIFMPDHFILDIHSWGSSLKKIILLLLALIALHLELGPCKLSPIHNSMPYGVITLQVLFRQPYSWDFIDVASIYYIEDIISQQDSKIIWLLSFFCLFFSNVPWALIVHVVLLMY